MNAICTTCGTQFSDTDEAPAHCPICEDERQYVGLTGQSWTTLDDLRAKYKCNIEEEEEGLASLSVDPHFAIGQRAFLVETSGGNLLWDCISLLNKDATALIRAKGGLHAIAISHPHYYTTMIEWSRAFGDIPVYLHSDDAQWVMRPDNSIRYWPGESKELWSGLTLIRSGGHFAGGTVLHWRDGAAGKGALLSGDIIQVVPDRRYVSFMYSYPNYIPLNAASVKGIVKSVEPFTWDRIYGAFPRMAVASNGKDTLRRSADRYLKAIAGNPD